SLPIAGDVAGADDRDYAPLALPAYAGLRGRGVVCGAPGSDRLGIGHRAGSDLSSYRPIGLLPRWTPHDRLGLRTPGCAAVPVRECVRPVVGCSEGAIRGPEALVYSRGIKGMTGRGPGRYHFWSRE